MNSTRTILLLEDQALLSWEMEETLREAEIGDPVCITSNSGALSWLSHNTPDVAVLDVQVQDGESTQIAEVLVERGIPFIVHSAYTHDADAIPPVFKRGVWVPKLSAPHDLLKAMTSCLSQHDQIALRSTTA
jgi:DNA-binding NtrC family response regulator